MEGETGRRKGDVTEDIKSAGGDAWRDENDGVERRGQEGQERRNERKVCRGGRP